MFPTGPTAASVFGQTVSFTAAVASVAAGQGTPTGSVTFTVDGALQTVGPGDTLFIRRGVVHGFDNRSGALATCLCVLTPVILGPEYFREVAVLASSGPPDPAKMRELMQRHGLVPASP